MTPLTIHEAAAAIRAGTLTPVDLLEQCLERIDVYEPHVRAWVLVDRDGAREQALRLTDELKKGQNRGPLHGIPIGVKDIIDVFDLPTGCGSKLWANSIARQDATVVKRLRQAGAVILGKTVTTAYAFLDPPATRNPWNLSRTPGGSSSGSAAAVACGMCLGALASQTGGSTTRPASFCGVCSLKATHAFLPLDGVLPLAPTLDHFGIMARCVRDLELLYEAAAEPWLRRPPRGGEPAFAGLRGFFEDRARPEQRAAIDTVTARLEEAGARIEQAVVPAAFGELQARHRTVMAVEAAQFHEPRLKRHPDDYPLQIRTLVEEGMDCPAPEYARCLDHRESLVGPQSQTFLERGIYITPAAPGIAPGPETTGDAVFNSPWSYTGMPTVSVPVERYEGLPLAVQFVAGRWRETGLLAAAAWAERVIGYEVGLPPVPADASAKRR